MKYKYEIYLLSFYDIVFQIFLLLVVGFCSLNVGQFFMLKAIPDSKWPTSKTGQTIVTYLTFTVGLFSISPGGKTPWHGEAPNAAQ